MVNWGPSKPEPQTDAERWRQDRDECLSSRDLRNLARGNAVHDPLQQRPGLAFTLAFWGVLSFSLVFWGSVLYGIWLLWRR
jgi:hypothetical protein